ncbi:hypothetical protein [Pedobacter nyackensis]|uniref:Uncharacterized protein n=1 Tax=Pedobacter nyackensis TaxID=475255 RepID=A0A1W2EDQ0_9SPHI|nr:hypothetical protein [Pedobacter nyackensis]SMD07446.1 hypothetical protein SAMN04488101_111133 [Pedobacter nyackensis]
MPFKYLLLSICVFLCTVATAQEIDCGKVLDTEPYFVKHKTSEKDSLLKRDIAILKHCGNFESIDSVFLKGSMLGTLLLDQVRIGKPATYRTLIDYFNDYKKTIAYKDFVKGLLLYRELAQKKINMANWDTDKELFVRMGFTAVDLDDFKSFLTNLAGQDLTYRAALTKYMSEIEAMRIDK